MRTRKKVGIALATVGIAASSIGLVGASGATAAPVGRLQVVAVTTESSPDPTAAPKVGDSFAFGGDIVVVRGRNNSEIVTRSHDRRVRKIGRFGVECTITSVVHRESECTATIDIERRNGASGQVSAQGLIAEPAPTVTATGDHPKPKPTPIVRELDITGGTRAWNAAGGTLIVTDLNDTVSLLDFEFAS